MITILNQNQIIYSLDACSLIDAYRSLYPMENFPALWKKFEELIKKDRLKMSEFVYAEAMQDKVLKDWCLHENLKSYLELKIDDSTQREVRKILSKYPGMLKVKKGISGGDPWVIALATQYQPNVIVVTEEKLTGNLQYPRIPDVCKDSKIECVTIAGVVKKENWIF